MPSSYVHWLDPACDITGVRTQIPTKTLTEQSSMLGQTVTGQTGAVANITAFAGGEVTLTGLTGMTAQSRGRFLSIAGAATGANNGIFLISTYVSATSVKVVNASGVAPDGNNGAISWVEREPFSLEDDINFTLTDRAAIKGVAFDAAIPTYTRPTATGSNVPANLSNIAGKTLDAHAWNETRKFEDVAFVEGTTFGTLSDTGNLKHATSTDITGVPIQDGYDAGNHEDVYVELINPATESALEVKGYAFGTITTVAGSLLIDAETFVLDDGVNPAVTFEFDDDASVVQSATLRAIVFTGAETANQIRDLIVTAVNTAPTLAITAVSGGAALVNLINDAVGTAGNVTITETVVDAGFVVTGMLGGSANAGKRIFGRTRAGSSTSPDSVEVEFRCVTKGAALSTSSAYTWERNQPTSLDVFYAFRSRADQLNRNFARRTLVNGIVGDADANQDIIDIRTTIDESFADNATSLAGLLTNTGNYFPFVNLSDVTPSVVEALNTLNAQIGNRDYTGAILSDGQTITASLQALASAIAGSSLVRTVERLASTINANTSHTIPGAQTYTIDGTFNGANMLLFWRGLLRTPGPATDIANDYEESSTTSFTPYSKIKAGEVINYLIMS